MSLFLEPDVHQAVVRKAHADRTEFLTSLLRQLTAAMRRVPDEQPKPPSLLDKIRAVLEQYWALPLSRS